MLTFDPEKHVYYWNGERAPGVTTILSPLSEYAGIPRRILEEAAARGEYIHKACELLLWDQLDEMDLEPAFIPYIDAFKKFLSETGFQAEVIEQQVYHIKLGYAGTLDLGGILPPVGRMKKPRRALIDIKTTFKLLASVGPQTAAYSEAWASERPKEQHFDERYGLQLKGDGTYKMLPMKSSNDMNVFRSCLAIYNFMKREKGR